MMKGPSTRREQWSLRERIGKDGGSRRGGMDEHVGKDGLSKFCFTPHRINGTYSAEAIC